MPIDVAETYPSEAKNAKARLKKKSEGCDQMGSGRVLSSSRIVQTGFQTHRVPRTLFVSGVSRRYDDAGFREKKVNGSSTGR